MGCKQAADVELRGLPVLCTGGSAQGKGFPELLQAELRQLDSAFFKSAPMMAQQHAAWTGGALLASSPNFAELWITSSEHSNGFEDALSRKML